YVEAARCLADRLLGDAGRDDHQRLGRAMQTILARPATPAEVSVLVDVLRQQRALFREDPEAARALVTVGDSVRRMETDSVELASWTTLVAMILLTDEAIHKP
ncbi:MAG: hypothetical protein QGH11_14985, partial [Pirellulaceae bacterium]|nr:hypothetical protein [Pirellulaceae bacterium]